MGDLAGRGFKSLQLHSIITNKNSSNEVTVVTIFQ